MSRPRSLRCTRLGLPLYGTTRLGTSYCAVSSFFHCTVCVIRAAQLPPPRPGTKESGTKCVNVSIYFWSHNELRIGRVIKMWACVVPEVGIRVRVFAKVGLRRSGRPAEKRTNKEQTRVCKSIGNLSLRLFLVIAQKLFVWAVCYSCVEESTHLCRFFVPIKAVPQLFLTNCLRFTHFSAVLPVSDHVNKINSGLSSYIENNESSL